VCSTTDPAGVDPPDSGDPPAEGTGVGDTRAVEARQTDAADQESGDPTGMLEGQGGTRGREFEIEERTVRAS
jgi:hypothetical protein